MHVLNKMKNVMFYVAILLEHKKY